MPRRSGSRKARTSRKGSRSRARTSRKGSRSRARTSRRSSRKTTSRRRVARRSSRKSSRKTVSRRNTSRRRTQRGGGLIDRFAIALVNASVNKYISTEDYYKRNEKEKFNPRIEPDEFNTRIKKGKADNKKEQVYKMEAYNSFITHATNIIEITGKDENNGDIRKILDNLTTDEGRRNLTEYYDLTEVTLHKNVQGLVRQANYFVEKTWFLYDLLKT